MKNQIIVFKECFEDIVKKNYDSALQHISHDLLEDYKYNGNSETDKKVKENNTSLLTILKNRRPLENLVNFVYHESWKDGPFYLMRIQEISKEGAGDIRTVAFVVENDEYKIRYFDWRKERGLTKQRLLETKK